MIQFPEKFRFLLDPPLGSVPGRCAYGGRASLKSWQFARALLLMGTLRPLRILCGREFQSSIKDSVHRLLEEQITLLGLQSFYVVAKTNILGRNGTEFLFKGFRRDITQIKSTEGIDVCWIEEAEAVSKEHWEILTPTIRKEGSEIWVTFNPALATDFMYQMMADHPPANWIVKFVNYQDNPWLSAKTRMEAESMKRTDPDAYAHVWGGEPWRSTAAQIFAGKTTVMEFEPEPHWQGPYFGADWGFAVDPSVLIRLWIADNRLYVEYEESGIGLSMDDIGRMFRRVPESEDYWIRADSARPETINEMNNRGFQVRGAKKWEGSVKDGIEHLRSYDQIILHPRCKLIQREARLYQFKTDARTGDVLPMPLDKHNHTWDAIRYALAPLIQHPIEPTIFFPGMSAKADDLEEQTA